jgi:hypothetical protein
LLSRQPQRPVSLGIRAGGGQNPSSWNSAHDTACGVPAPGGNFQQGTVSQGGGIGAIYCFAAD